MGGSGDEKSKGCGLTQFLIFTAAIVSGTACSLCSKLMMELHSVGISGETEKFAKPIFQTFGMFVGMTFGLLMHWAVVYFRIPFPGYIHAPSVPKVGSEAQSGGKQHATETDTLLESGRASMQDYSDARNVGAPPPSKLPTWMYFFLAIPSIFDLAATALCMMGLRFLDASIYQMLRGSGIIFVALMKQHVLGDPLYRFQWFGVYWNVVSVVLVGVTAMLASSASASAVEGSDAFVGVLLVLAGAFVQALQFVFEEKVMSMDIPAPPLLLIGMEGVWGTVLCLFVVYPLAYFTPGSDHGSYEDPFNTYEMILNSPTIQWAFVIYFFTIFAYNLFAVLVTFMLSSVWHAILDNFRPITVWGTDLFIFYVATAGSFGEPWSGWGYLQLAGMAVLLYGTAVYNAPNAGSIVLRGQWWALGFDFGPEYDEIRAEEMDSRWEERQERFQERRGSSIYVKSSPHMSVHTQSLRGLGSAKS